MQFHMLFEISKKSLVTMQLLREFEDAQSKEQTEKKMKKGFVAFSE